MTRIITHQEETHYELAANSENLEFWKTLGFKIIGTGEREDEFYLRKTCSFGIRQQLGGLAIIQGGYSQQMGMHSASLPISED